MAKTRHPNHKTSVVLTAHAEQLLRNDLGCFGLKEVLSASLELFAKLPKSEQCDHVARMKKEEPRGRPGRKDIGKG